jgi:hypothetical protein
MTTSSLRMFSVAAVAFSFVSASPSADQVRRQSPKGATVPMEVALKVGHAGYDAKGQGSCTHARQASIYNVLSEMWTVRHEDDGRSFQLTLWKPKDGSAPMFSLAINGKPDATVSTVRGGQVSGSGTVKLEPSVKGGTFTVDAKEKSGATIAGTIRCEAFTPAIAEGGN